MEFPNDIVTLGDDINATVLHRFKAIAVAQSTLLLDPQAKHAAGDSLDN
jgi:hypothetical protein